MLKHTKYFIYLLLALSLVQVSCKKVEKSPAQTLPAITAVSPASAIVGTTVEIKGVNLKDVAKVKFGTVEASFNASANTDTSVTVDVPAGLTPGDLFVQVYLTDGSYNAYNFTVLETPKVPEISSIDPVKALPGTEVIISGINFAEVSTVKFGDVTATFTATDTKIITNVPMNAAGGDQLITVTALTGSDTISFNVDLSPVVSSISPDQAKEGDLITVSGLRFTGATSVVLGIQSVTFTVVDDNTITFTVPAGALSGNIIVTTPLGSGTSNSALTILAAGLAFPIYDDAVTSNWSNAGGWIGGGWGGTKDLDNTSPVETGVKSCQISYVGGWGSPLQLGGASVDLTPYTLFKISIYGGVGTNGLKVNIGINQADAYTITLVEGVWTDYQLPISSLTSSSTLNEIWVKEYNGTGGFTIYVDNIGLN